MLFPEPDDTEPVARLRPIADDLEGWIVIADGTNYRDVKMATLSWLDEHGRELDDSDRRELKLDFLAGVGGSATIRTRLPLQALASATGGPGQD